MGNIIAFNDESRVRRSATVRPQPTRKKGYPNHHVQAAVVAQFVDRGKSIRALGADLRRVYGPSFGERTVERILRDRVRFSEEAA